MLVEYPELIEETQARVSAALAGLVAGADPDDAVLSSGMLALFDDGDDIDGALRIDVLPGGGGGPWEAHRAGLVAEALVGILHRCRQWTPADGGEAITADLVERYHHLATLVPVALWRYRLLVVLRRLGEKSVGAQLLATARARAVDTLGGADEVMDAVRAWEPDDDERLRLQRLLFDGHTSQAMVQALEQAVFAAQLAEL